MCWLLTDCILLAWQYNAIPVPCICASLPHAQVYKVLEPVLVEKNKAEEVLMAQDKMAFVIVRPGGLTDDPASGNGVLTESTSVAGSIARDDVAALVVKALLSKKADGKVGVYRVRKEGG